MRILLDTNVLIAALRRTSRTAYPQFADVLHDPDTTTFASVASLWEIAIKVRLGKLDAGVPIGEVVALATAARLQLVPITPDHAVAEVTPEPPTRDPFDRMLLAQCAVEGLRLVTVDRALVGHPLAWRPA